jgi:hypothetical protein
MGAALVALLLLAGIGKAVADALAHGSTRLDALGPFWRHATSWTRKYKDYYGGDHRARFFGAKTFLVGLTDAWHASNTVQGLASDAALLLAGWPTFRWYAVVAVVARRCIFVPVYKALRS